MHSGHDIRRGGPDLPLLEPLWCRSTTLPASAGDYGLAHVMPVAETWVADTWATGPRIGETAEISWPDA